MAFYPSIQSLVGAHSSNASIGIDWVRNRCFEADNTWVSRYGLLSGLEEAFIATPDGGGCVGVAANGNFFLPGPSGLNNGSALYRDGDTLGAVNTITYADPNFGAHGMQGVTSQNGNQFLVDLGSGNIVIPVLNRIQEASTTTWLAEQDFAGAGGYVCPGPAGTGTAYVISGDEALGGTHLYLNLLTFSNAGFVSNVNAGTIPCTDIAAGFLCIPTGICLDQTDGNLIIMTSGSGAAHNGYLAKLDKTSGAVLWSSPLPHTAGDGPIQGGNTFSYSDIRHQRLGLYSQNPVQTATIWNTADGSVVDTYTTGLSWLVVSNGEQAYNDTLSALVLSTGYTNNGGSPTPLNGTPHSFTGWAALYLAAPAPSPPPETDVWFALMGPVRPRA